MITMSNFTDDDATTEAYFGTALPLTQQLLQGERAAPFAHGVSTGEYRSIVDAAAAASSSELREAIRAYYTGDGPPLCVRWTSGQVEKFDALFSQWLLTPARHRRRTRRPARS